VGQVVCYDQNQRPRSERENDFVGIGHGPPGSLEAAVGPPHEEGDALYRKPMRPRKGRAVTWIAMSWEAPQAAPARKPSRTPAWDPGTPATNTPQGLLAAPRPPDAALVHQTGPRGAAPTRVSASACCRKTAPSAFQSGALPRLESRWILSNERPPFSSSFRNSESTR
jgi:hypothetical protein